MAKKQQLSWRLKITYSLLIVLLILFFPTLLWSQTTEVTNVKFPILEGKMKLSGVISQPKDVQPNSPLLILVSPPQPINRNYGGLYKALSDSLNNSGFITFRYDNRNYSDTTATKPNDGRYTMYDAADDLHDAFVYLKTDKRFLNRPIGIIGHSEGGSSAIIETARNSDVKFLLLLSTSGVSGELFIYTQSVSKFEFLLDKLTPQERNLLIYSIYYPAHIIANNINNEKAFSILEKEARRVYKENRHIESFFGKMDEEKYVEDIVDKWTKNPRELAFMRYNPAAYFNKIKCPVFIAYAKDDNKLRCDENIDALERILMNNRVYNYKSIVIDSVGHSFEDTKGIRLPIYVSVNKKNDKGLGKGFTVLCKNMVEWIKEVID